MVTLNASPYTFEPILFLILVVKVATLQTSP